jgi:hypothetical protein
MNSINQNRSEVKMEEYSPYLIGEIMPLRIAILSKKRS